MQRHAGSLAAIVLAAAVLISSGDAWAKPLCVSAGNGDWTYIFPKLKKLKPGGAIALTGYRFEPLTQMTVAGTASMDWFGVVHAAIVIDRMSAGSAWYSESATLDSTFAGTAVYDTDMDGFSNASGAWAPVDCAGFFTAY